MSDRWQTSDTQLSTQIVLCFEGNKHQWYTECNTMADKVQSSRKKHRSVVIFVAILLIAVLLVLFFWPTTTKQSIDTVIDSEQVIVNTSNDTSVVTNLNTSTPTFILGNTDITNSWVYVTDVMRFSITPNGDSATCTLEWIDREPSTVALYTIDAASTERRGITTNINENTCVVNEDVTQLGYIGITLNGEDSGGLEAPLNEAADTVGMMHAMFTLPDNPTTIYPTSGIWNYNMTFSDSNLDCSVGSFASSADGQVSFITSNYGLSATMNADDSSVYFSRLGYANPEYETSEYSFPTYDDYGSVRYTLHVNDQEHMSGTLHMQGDVCAGEYPITMELLAATVPPIIVPHQGSWNIQYGPLFCGGTMVEPTSLIGLPLGSAVLSVTGGGPIPMQLAWQGSPGNLNMMQSIGSNIYSSFSNVYLGTAFDLVTGIPFTLMGSWNASVLSETQIMSTVSVIGSNGCVGAMVVQLQQY